ncbi:acetyl-CoA synthetase-like protein [Glonium stellatum]|uniref:Acetyl-CoA synthetase-like protein n=1 Tax=Glonium stellatum TaxID=574774 RepID=A0A8E2F7Y0_9PEZI|nr:acetyl-CoA synthetase-like protein [Glonium stellatum]
MHALQPSPSHGGMVLPRVVEELAANQPERTWVTVPKDANLTSGWRDITFKELDVAVNSTCRWIESTIGISSDRETLSYMGSNDVRYVVVLLAAMKTGYKIMLPSLRNSEEGHLSLLEHTQCRKFISTKEIKPQVESFKHSRKDLVIYEIPEYEHIIDSNANTSRYFGHYSEAEDDQVIVLHTSGSTGLPKPIYITNGGLATIGVLKVMPAPQGHINAHDVLLSSDQPLFTMLPFFHAMGLISVLRSIFCCGPLILPPAGRPMNADLVMECIKQTKPWGGFFAPSMLEELSSTQQGIEVLQIMQYIFYGGAPLAREAGNKISQITNLVVMIGSTEAGLIPNMMPSSKEDWDYFEWSLESGVEMEPASDGLCEMVVKRLPNRKYQGIFHTFPNIKEWRTKDLYERHPSKPTLWRYKGRKDDVIVLSNGEKFNPVGLEKAIEGHPLVRGALVVGQGRFQVGLLVEPKWDALFNRDNPTDILERIWPHIEEANKESPAYGRVWKSKIAIAKREKPFVRAPKGSIIRRQTVQLYEKEIDALYSNEGFQDELGSLTEDADLPTVKVFLRRVFSLTLPSFKDDRSDDTDIFALGADSLQVLALSSALSHAVQSAKGTRPAAITPRLIYANPTVEKLAKELKQSVLCGSGQSDDSATISAEQEMAEIVKKYTDDLPEASENPLPAPQDKHTVILTGSTGSLGNYILEVLISNPRISHIYCLNRSDNASTRQEQSFLDRGATPDFTNTTFWRADLGSERLGLSPAQFQTLQSSATAIVHNAWAVDFNQALASYEPTHIRSIRRLVDLSASSPRRPHIAFVSSIASVGAWATAHAGLVPERFFPDDAIALPQGYARSKHVAARILAAAAQRAGVRATVIRAGQLAGPRDGRAVWNLREWLPSLVVSSRAMGVLPRTLGNMDQVDWVPVDVAARVVVDVVMARVGGETGKEEVAREPFDVFHVVNPRVVTWRELVPAIRRWFGEDKVGVVDFGTWLERLRQTPLTPEEVARKPGVKLLDFYAGLVEGKGLPRLATTRTVQVSDALRELEPVNGGLIEAWLRRWEDPEAKM